MHIIFTYNLDKEFDNLLRGLKTQHNPEHQPKLVREMMAANIDLQSKDAVLNFIKTKIEKEKIDMPLMLETIQEKWRAVEIDVADRLNEMFATKDPFETISVYLSLNGRSSYSYPDYFFVCITLSPIGTIIHELMHFYTHLLIQPMFIEQNAEAKFGEFKEALTVLINHEFKDLIEIPDKGYEKHTETRHWIESNWKKGMTIQELTKLYLK